MKRLLTLMIALVLVISSGSIVMAEAKDYDGSWAKEEISYMISKDVLAGYEDGTFKPGNDMTKAEFYTVVNQLFGFEETAEVEFEDVVVGNWFYGQVGKGLKAGYISPLAKLNPNSKITRGEVAKIISFVYEIEENENEAKKFEDFADMPEDIVGAIGGLKKVDLIAGYPDGTFKPSAEITRAEVVRMLYSASGKIINQAGEVSEDLEGNLLVNAADVVLKDMTIKGNLYLTEGIGEGDVTLDNVTVEGQVFVRAGGENSIIIKNSNINKISINKTKSTKVRVVLENTKVNEVKASNNVKLELSKKSEVKSVELNDMVSLDMEKDTKIDSLKTESKDITIKSEGKIEKLETKKDIKVNDEVVKADTTSKVDEGKTTTETKTPSTPAKTPSTGGSSGGGGGSSGGSSGGGSTSTSITRLERARRDLESLERQTEDFLRIKGNEAAVELKGDVDVDVDEFVKRYKKIVSDKEIETNQEVEKILTTLKDSNTVSNEKVNELREEYNTKKAKARAEAIKIVEDNYRELPL